MSAKNRGIYLLPNLLTTAGLFSGFYAVIASMNHHFESAAVAIFIAMIWDGFDGRVARLMNAQSTFGAEYDSLADMVSFGIAPALVVYNWSLSGGGKLGWLAAFVYAAGGALRLARFNSQIPDRRYFQGLPIPAAASLIAGMVWMGQIYGLCSTFFAIIAGILTFVTGLLMVSNFRYRSFKDLAWRNNVSFLVVLVVVLSFVVVSLSPPVVLFTASLIYVISGPVLTYRTTRKMKMEHVVGDADEDFYDGEEEQLEEKEKDDEDDEKEDEAGFMQ